MWRGGGKVERRKGRKGEKAKGRKRARGPSLPFALSPFRLSAFPPSHEPVSSRLTYIRMKAAAADPPPLRSQGGGHHAKADLRAQHYAGDGHQVRAAAAARAGPLGAGVSQQPLARSSSVPPSPRTARRGPAHPPHPPGEPPPLGPCPGIKPSVAAFRRSPARTPQLRDEAGPLERRGRRCRGSTEGRWSRASTRLQWRRTPLDTTAITPAPGRNPR